MEEEVMRRAPLMQTSVAPCLNNLHFLTHHPQSGEDFTSVGSGSFGSVFLALLPVVNRKRLLYNGTPISTRDQFTSYHSQFVPTSQTENTNSSVLVAVKKLKNDNLDDILREARNLEVVSQFRNVTKVYGAVHDQSLKTNCIVMDFVEGTSLNQFLRSQGSAVGQEIVHRGEKNCSIPCRAAQWWKIKIEIFRELVLGLIQCHKRGIYHGDLKGENVLLDKFLVPKLIDFGMSFRKKDLSYYREVGGSFFWVSPEILEVEGISPEVEDNPYPSDIYSLGMILVEMSLDGEVPPDMSSIYMYLKLQENSPIPLAVADDVEDSYNFYQILKTLVDQCCRAERNERFSLEECLVSVHNAYKEICIICDNHCSAGCEQLLQEDACFTASTMYQDILQILKRRLPDIPDCILLQPSKNMMVDVEGNLLIHYFCSLDYWEGVDYIIRHKTWEFDPMKEIPFMSLICVRTRSLSVIKHLAREWKDILVREQMLVHEACKVEDLDMLQFLLFDVEMDYDTWDREEMLKPIHKLALAGKNDMMQTILDQASALDASYIDTVIWDWLKTPLFYAVKGDHMESVLFLMDKGAGINLEKQEEKSSSDLWEAGGGKLFDTLFAIAIDEGSARVVTGLLKIGCVLYCATPAETDTLLHQFARDKQCKENLMLLEEHMKFASNCNPIHLACTKKRQRIFEILRWLEVIRPDVEGIDEVVVRVCECGSAAMLELLINSGICIRLHAHELLDLALKNSNTEIYECISQKMDTWSCEEVTKEHHSQEGGGSDKWTADELSEEQQQSSSNTEDKIHQILRDVEILGSSYNKDDDVPWASQTPRDESDGVLTKLESLAVLCCESGNLEMLKALEKDVGLDVREASPRAGLLQTAAAYGQERVVRHLLERGAPVDSKSDFLRETPLLCTKSLKVREMLLKAGADPNYRDQAGCTAMDRALGMGDTKYMKLLIHHGFNLGLKDRDDNTLMSRLADMGEPSIHAAQGEAQAQEGDTKFWTIDYL